MDILRWVLRPVPKPVRVAGTLVTTAIGILGLVGFSTWLDDLGRWPPILSAIVGWLTGDVGRWLLVIGAVLLLLYLNWPRNFAMPAARESATDMSSNDSRWLPNGDLTAFAMTNDDLNWALARAEEHLRETLAPDALVKFDRLVVPTSPTYGYRPQVDFSGWSSIADRGHVVSVLEDASIYAQGPAKMWEPMGDLAPAWALDGSWQNLVRHSWYRVRPTVGTGYGVLTHKPASKPGDEWGDWSMCYVSEPKSQEVVCFRLRNGSLSADPSEAVEPFHWG